MAGSTKPVPLSPLHPPQLGGIEIQRGTFEYDQLLHDDSFRLIRLLPGFWTEPIRCELFIERFFRRPKYQALSYVWGDQNVRRIIHVNDGTLHITQSLEWALRRIRSSSESLVLWCDAISIDQSNLKERGHQVAQMRNLYMSASHVLICLGDDPEELTFNATDTIRILAGDVRGLLEEHGSWESLPEVQWSEVDNWEGLKWSALARLSRKEWFKRVWVWQEVGLAKNATILYGDSEADWDDLMTVFKWLTHRAEELEELYDLEVSETNELWSSYDLENRDYIYPNDGHRSLENFIELLEKTRDLKASDPRDKLYAFLGHPLLDLVIKPNYELPVWKVYAQFVQAWVNRFRCLQILSMAGTSKVVTKSEVMTTAYFDFPTWCPRWNEPSDTRWPFYGYGFNTGTYRECEVSIVYEGVLILQGAKFDSVKTVKPQIDFPDTPYLIQRDSGAPGIYSALDISLEIRGTFTSSDGIWSKKGLVSTLVGGYQYGDELTAVCESFENYISQLRAKGRDVYEKLDDVIDGVRGNVNGDAEVFLSNATAACSGRRFFMTERGYYGLGPDGMEAGDICVIFFGGEVPFILRPSAEFYYYLVGECYVHGIMHGEVRRIVEKEELFHLL